jgi:hypothetical protein
MHASNPQDLADLDLEVTHCATVRLGDAVILDDRAWRAKYGGGGMGGVGALADGLRVSGVVAKRNAVKMPP